MRKLRLVAGVLIAVAAALVVSVYAFLVTLDLEDYREEIVARVTEATGRQLTVTGEMDLQFGLTPVVTVEQVSLANADWAPAGEMAHVRHMEVAVGLLALLRGELEVQRLVLVEPVLRLARNAEGDGNWQLSPRVGEQRPAREGLPELPVIDSVIIENARVSYTDPAREHPREVLVQRMEAQRTETGRLDVVLDGSYSATAFTLEGEVGSLETLLATGMRYPVDLRLATQGARAEIFGHLEAIPGLLHPDLRVSITGDLDVFRPPLAAMPPTGSYALSGRVTRIEDGFQVEGLEARLGESDLSGRLRLLLSGLRPKLTGNLSAARLDIAGLWREEPVQAEVGLADESETPNEDWQVFPDLALPFAGLDAIDADVEARIGALRLANGFTLASVDGRILLDQGRLIVDSLRADLNHAPLRLSLDADTAASPAEISLRLEGDGIDYGRLLSDTGVSGRVSGAMDLRAELRGAGETPRALAETLSGNLSITGEEGRLEHLLLDAASADIGGALAPWRERGEDLRLNCVVARFHIEDGVMQSRALLADTQAAALGGDGTISLADERFDLRLVPHSKRTSLMSLAVPVRLEGPLHAPHFAPDALGAARAGALAVGAAVNPLATLAALIVEAATANENPCVAALEQVEGSESDPGERGGIDGFLEGLGRTIERQLGGEGNGDTDDGPVLRNRGGVPGP